MKNKKKTYTLVAILLAIAALGIGYAVISSVLTINGTANILQSDGATVNFVTGSATTSGGETNTAAAISNGTTATCTVYLKTKNQTATCSYTINNVSTNTALIASNLTATVYDSSDAVWSSSSDGYEYISVTPSISPANATLANNGTDTATVNVVVELLKENTTGANITKTFTVKITGDTTQS